LLPELLLELLEPPELLDLLSLPPHAATPRDRAAVAKTATHLVLLMSCSSS
jgi:hypothetical protein